MTQQVYGARLRVIGDVGDWVDLIIEVGSEFTCGLGNICWIVGLGYGEPASAVESG